MPRHTYLMRKDKEADPTCCRGGVLGPEGDSDYALEIGQQQYCDPEMLALAAHVDEIRALLSTGDDVPASRRAIVWRSWRKLVDELRTSLHKEEYA